MSSTMMEDIIYTIPINYQFNTDATFRVPVPVHLAAWNHAVAGIASERRALPLPMLRSYQCWLAGQLWGNTILDELNLGL